MKASEVTLWSDVAGVFTTDPRVVGLPVVHTCTTAGPRKCPYGAKVLHQRTMIPVAQMGFPSAAEVPNRAHLAQSSTVVSARAAIPLRRVVLSRSGSYFC